MSVNLIICILRRVSLGVRCPSLRCLRLFCLVLFCLSAVSSAHAEIETKLLLPITRRVYIQPIVVTDSSGGNSATFFGNEPAHTSILNMVDKIWAQAGIDMQWLPEKSLPNSNFLSLDNSDAVFLGLDDAARVAGVWNSSPHTINAFFVKSYNGQTPGIGASAYGTAFLHGNATYQAIGLATVTSPNDFDNAAHLISHELGHSLGLSHAFSSANLMKSNATPDSGEELTEQGLEQISTLRASQFLISMPTPSAADFDGNGHVDVSDLLVWQNGYGGFYADGDSDFDGDVDGTDFLTWQRSLGTSPALPIGSVIPEPSVFALASLGLFCCGLARRRAIR